MHPDGFKAEVGLKTHALADILSEIISEEDFEDTKVGECSSSIEFKSTNRR